MAIKVLPPDLTLDDTAKQRFLQEAKAASALDHPNICTIHEINETDDGQLYLVMAHYEGETLKERIARGYWNSWLHAQSMRVLVCRSGWFPLGKSRGIHTSRMSECGRTPSE